MTMGGWRRVLGARRYEAALLVIGRVGFDIPELAAERNMLLGAGMAPQAVIDALSIAWDAEEAGCLAAR